MLIRIKKASTPRGSEITPESVFLNRRAFIAAAAASVGGATLGPYSSAQAAPKNFNFGAITRDAVDGFEDLGPNDKVTFPTAFWSYNNFNEFGPDKDDPARLAGAFTPWGGHKGAGLGMVVQMLGILAGSPVDVPEMADFGYLMVTMKPDLMMPEAEYRQKVTDYAKSVRAARPVAGGGPVRMPFDRSAADRRAALERDRIEVTELVLNRLREVAG